MERRDGRSAQHQTAMSSAASAQLDEKVELTLHNFTVISIPAASEADAPAASPEVQHSLAQSADVPGPTSPSFAAAVGVVLARVETPAAETEAPKALSAAAMPETGDGCESPDGGDPSSMRTATHTQAVRARDRRMDEEAVCGALCRRRLLRVHSGFFAGERGRC
jgi:hypothetical protein